MYKYILVIDHIATGGAERILLDYYHYLIQNGNKAVIFCLSGQKGESHWTEGLNIVYGSSQDEGNLLRKTWQQVNLLHKLSNLVKEEKPDVVFSFLEKSNLLSFLSSWKIKKVLTVHNVLSIQYQKITSKVIQELVYWMIRNAYNRCNKIVAVSDQVKDDLVNSFNVKKENITVINNYVDRSAIAKKSLEDIDNFTFDGKTRYVINIGRFSDQKAQWKLIKAFSVALKKGLDNTVLVLMGKGEYMKELGQLAKDLGLESKIVFLPFHINPYKYMAHSHLFVLSSIFEGFPIVLAEVSSLRIPFIGSRKSIPREMFDNNQIWENTVFDSTTFVKDFTTAVHEDEQELAELIIKGVEDDSFRNEILVHTKKWENNNNKEFQFQAYEKLIRR